MIIFPNFSPNNSQNSFMKSVEVSVGCCEPLRPVMWLSLITIWIAMRLVRGSGMGGLVVSEADGLREHMGTLVYTGILIM